jgi:WD40 repeat protein/tRNA A-37 threonylcarbamoyl transferase component Bud32
MPAPLPERTLPLPPSSAGNAGTEQEVTLERPSAAPKPPDDSRTAVLPQSESSRPQGTPAASSPANGAGYEILGELGRGGMGVVYKARQLRLNRLTALKMVLAGGHASRQDLDRFQAEAQAVAHLRHPNIVQIYEVGERDGRPFFSLEYVEGGSLQKKLDGTPLDARAAARLTETLAQAMHYAHGQGIVHRDLKPANVLLTADGTPKITDFGLAKSLGDDSGRTGSGAILGTPSYMAPEQAGGKAKDVGPTADVYALGAMLYEMLAGRPPFRGQSVLDTLQQVQNVEPVAPRRLQPRVPRDLETICLRCLHKEPHRRYTSAQALAEDLQRFREGKPIEARPVGLTERTYKWARRRPGMAALVAALFLSLVGGFIGIFALWLQAEGRRREAVAAMADAQEQRNEARRKAHEADEASATARKEKQAADLARDAAMASYEEARRHRYATGMNLAQTALNAGHGDRALQTLEDLKQTRPGEGDLSGFEWHFLKRLAGSQRLDLKGHVNQLTQVAFSPDGTRLASASLDRTVRVWDLGTSRSPLKLGGHLLPVRAVAFSPDARIVASAGADGLVFLWDANTGKRLRALAADGPGSPAHKQGANGIAFSPDGTHLASAGQDETVRVWDVATGKLLNTFKGHRYGVLGVAFSPNGRRLASAGEDHTVRLWDLDAPSDGLELRGHTFWVTSVAFSPDGKQLASGSWDRTVRLWDLTGRRPPQVLPGTQRPVRSVAFSADDRYLAAADSEGMVRVWDRANDLEARTLAGKDGLVRTVSFSADGELLASVDFEKQIGELTPTFKGHDGAVDDVTVSPDGKRVASAGLHVEAGGPVGGEVKVWDPRTLKEVFTLRAPGGLVRSVAYSPDGKYLAWSGEGAAVHVVLADTGKPVRVLTGHARRVHCVRFARDGRLASCDEDGIILLHDLASSSPPLRLTGHVGAVRALAFSPDGKHLASAGADTVVRIWDLATGTAVQRLGGHRFAVTCLAYNKNGTLLASGSEDQTVRLWDPKTGKAKRAEPLRGHTHGVTAVDFSPDGKRLASASEDKTVKLWDTVSGEEVLTLHGHSGRVTGVAFDPSGRRLLSSSWDQTVRLWDGAP